MGSELFFMRYRLRGEALNNRRVSPSREAVIRMEIFALLAEKAAWSQATAKIFATVSRVCRFCHCVSGRIPKKSVSVGDNTTSRWFGSMDLIFNRTPPFTVGKITALLL